VLSLFHDWGAGINALFHPPLQGEGPASLISEPGWGDGFACEEHTPPRSPLPTAKASENPPPSGEC